MSSKKKTVATVLNMHESVTIGGREFTPSRPKLGEAYLVNRFTLLEAQMQHGDLDAGLEAQAAYNAVWARLLTARAVDGEPVTPEWIAEQTPDDLATIIAPEGSVGEAKPR